MRLIDQETKNGNLRSIYQQFNQQRRIELAKAVLQEQWDARLEGYTEHRLKIKSEVEEIDEKIDTCLQRIHKVEDEA